MILLNFAHPLTPEQQSSIEALADRPIDRLAEINSQVDTQQPLSPQVSRLVEQAGLTPTEWQTAALLVNPPALNFIAAALLAELHGRCGYFVPIVRLRPAADSIPPRYEVAEIIDLQDLRDTAREKRSV